MTTLLTLFAAGMLTILLPCILPLVPIVLGVSVSGQRRGRPLAITLGMVVSFVASTFLLEVVLRPLAQVSDLVRTANDDALVLFGICFLVERRWLRLLLALGSGLLFLSSGWLGVLVACAAGVVAVLFGGRLATRLQHVGAQAQQHAGSRESLWFAFVVGLTLGLVWSPCAGPALAFALTLVREEGGVRALTALAAYALGAALPLLMVGYGGQRLLGHLGWLVRRTGLIKRVAGVAFIATALAVHGPAFAAAQTWVGDHSALGRWGSSLEQGLWRRQAAHAVASSTPSTGMPALPKLGPAPELAGLGPWYNSAPLSLSALRGKVVLVDFWTYSCINCVRTLPSMRALWSKYHDQPFVIIGVHTPEFGFEKLPANVAQAVQRHGLSYPIAQDDDFATWKAFGNEYWPAKYLIDTQGNLRYTHFGEGNEDATDAAIRSLLAEAGCAPPAPGQAMRAAARAERISPETYLGQRGWDAFANRQGSADHRVRHYQAVERLPVDAFALVGDWQLAGPLGDGERQVLRSSSGQVRFHAQAGEVNLVLGIEPGAAPVSAEVSVDGKPVTRLTIDHDDVYNLFRGSYGLHEVVVRLHGQRVAAYAFTFGA